MVEEVSSSLGQVIPAELVEFCRWLWLLTVFCSQSWHTLRVSTSSCRTSRYLLSFHQISMSLSSCYRFLYGKVSFDVLFFEGGGQWKIEDFILSSFVFCLRQFIWNMRRLVMFDLFFEVLESYVWNEFREKRWGSLLGVIVGISLRSMEECPGIHINLTKLYPCNVEQSVFVQV